MILRLASLVLAFAASQAVARAQVAPVVPLGAAIQSQMNAAGGAPAPGAMLAPGAAPQPQAGAKDKPKRKPLALDARVIPLGGALKTPEAWQAYKARFVTENGRVIDTGNGMISHSEGQGYAMLLAVAANDRATFDRLWGWTRANLMVRDDQLVAWRWEPTRRPAVADINNASDGDLLIAWALAEAGEFWGEVALRAGGRRIAVEVGRKLVVARTKLGALLLPAVAGFSGEERADGPVVNPSYWVFPAFARLTLVAPEVDWNGVVQSGLDVLRAARFGASALPAEWVSLKDGVAKPADGFPAQFGYNAVRIPLYLAWAGVGERDHYDPFVAWARTGRPSVVELASGAQAGALGEGGYASVGALALCAAEGVAMPADTAFARAPEHYYPATLRLLAVVAAQMRYPTCLRG